MLQYVLSRLIQAALTILMAVVLVFFAVRLTPGDPAELLLPRGAPPEQIEALRRAWGLDDPLPLQFIAYFRSLIRGNLGNSLVYGEPVLAIILDRLPATFQLAICAMGLALCVAIPLGILCAIWSGSVLDHVVTTAALFTQSVPSFWLGVQLILIFSLTLGLLPSSGFGGMKYLVFPAITLSADVTALMIRVIRTETMNVLRQDYIRTAYAKGLKQWQVISRHVFRNAANPLVTVVGLRFGAMLGGAVVTETIFAWPGIGRLVVQSVLARDYPLIQGIVLVAAVVFTMVHVLVDMVYCILDPRVRYSKI